MQLTLDFEAAQGGGQRAEGVEALRERVARILPTALANAERRQAMIDRAIRRDARDPRISRDGRGGVFRAK